MSKFSFIFIVVILFATHLRAQVYIEFGSLNFLKEDTTLNVIYNYDNLQVGDLTEEEYIAKRKDDSNGHVWLASWLGNRTQLYQPSFQKYLNRKLRKCNFNVHPSKNLASYTILVKTRFIEPGFWAYRVSMPSQVVIEFSFFKNTDPTTVLAVLKAPPFKGVGFDPASRIQSAYINAGNALGKFLKDHVFQVKQLD